MQKHDIGYQKRIAGKPPLERDRLKLERAKRIHPGPLPERLVNKEGEEEGDREYSKRIVADYIKRRS